MSAVHVEIVPKANAVDRTKPTGNSPGIPGNLQEFASERLETPKEMLSRTLGNGEKVVASFECYFQSDRISRAEYWYRVVTTFGFFLLAKWYKRVMDSLFCRRVQAIQYTRGTLVVTSLGRIISWNHEYDQQPIDPKAKKGSDAAKGLPYKILHTKKVFNMKDIRQISLRISSPEMGGGILDFFPCLAGILRCCGLAEFESGIAISFFSFDDSVYASDPSGLVTAGTAASFTAIVSAIFGRLFFSMSTVETTTVTITSANDDMVHNLNGKSDPKGTIQDLTNLQTKFMAALKIVPSFLGKADSSATSAIFSDPSIVGTTIVDTDGNVKIPRECLPLMAGEFVIDSKSFVYKLNFSDWVNIISTMGYAYCGGAEPIRNRRFQRAVLVMTNVRIISVYICERSGSVPTHLTNFEFSATSYFPGDVRAGTLNCDGINRIDSSLLCEGGRLTVSMGNMNNFCTFPFNCCPSSCPVTSLDPKLIQFSLHMQNVAAKSIPLDVKLRKFVKTEVAAKIGLLDEGALKQKMEQMAESASKALVQVGSDTESRTTFSAFETSMLPLVAGETLVNRFVASQRYMPCCKLPSGTYLCPSQCGPCAMCFTCGIRPVKCSESSIVTSHAIYHLGRASTYPWPCVKSLVPPKQQGFVIAWAPIRALRGQSFSFTASGILPKHEKGIFGGKYKKTPGPSSYAFSILFEDFTFVYSGSKADRNWLADDELNYEQHVFDQVQLTLLGAGATPVELVDLEAGCMPEEVGCYPMKM